MPLSTHTCFSCTATFPTSSKRDVHYRCCVAKCRIRYPDGRCVTVRREGTFFTCSCGRNFQTSTGIQKHTREGRCLESEAGTQRGHSEPVPNLIFEHEGTPNLGNSDVPEIDMGTIVVEASVELNEQGREEDSTVQVANHDIDEATAHGLHTNSFKCPSCGFSLASHDIAIQHFKRSAQHQFTTRVPHCWGKGRKTMLVFHRQPVDFCYVCPCSIARFKTEDEVRAHVRGLAGTNTAQQHSRKAYTNPKFPPTMR